VSQRRKGEEETEASCERAKLFSSLDLTWERTTECCKHASGDYLLLLVWGSSESGEAASTLIATILEHTY
jgi:hypothetical protein